MLGERGTGIVAAPPARVSVGWNAAPPEGSGALGDPPPSAVDSGGRVVGAERLPGQLDEVLLDATRSTCGRRSGFPKVVSGAGMAGIGGAASTRSGLPLAPNRVAGG